MYRSSNVRIMPNKVKYFRNQIFSLSYCASHAPVFSPILLFCACAFQAKLANSISILLLPALYHIYRRRKSFLALHFQKSRFKNERARTGSDKHFFFSFFRVDIYRSLKCKRLNVIPGCEEIIIAISRF